MPENIAVGMNVYVKQPQSFIPDCTCIVGDVIAVERGFAIVSGSVGRMGGGYPIEVAIKTEFLGERFGTPLSKISTRPGTAGYGEWLRISRSWGYE